MNSLPLSPPKKRSHLVRDRILHLLGPSENAGACPEVSQVLIWRPRRFPARTQRMGDTSARVEKCINRMRAIELETTKRSGIYSATARKTAENAQSCEYSGDSRIFPCLSHQFPPRRFSKQLTGSIQVRSLTKLTA